MEKEFLEDAFPELNTLEGLLKDWEANENEIDPGLVLLLVRAMREKLDYFGKKYRFEIEAEDLMFIEDYADLIRKKEAFSGQAPK